MKTLKKKPVQIYLDEKQDDVLEYFSDKLKISKAEIIRRSVADYLKKIPVEKDPALKIVGLGKSGLGDLSTRHDEYLVKFSKGQRKKTK